MRASFLKSWTKRIAGAQCGRNVTRAPGTGFPAGRSRGVAFAIVQLLQRQGGCYSALSLARATTVEAGRAPFGRPAIPIDIAAFSYHWSALKMTRRALFFSGRSRARAFLALEDRDAVSFAAAPLAAEAAPFAAVPFEGTFFAIVITRLIPTAPHLSSDRFAVTGASAPWPYQPSVRYRT